MKLREVFYRLGFKPKPKRYGFELREQTVEGMPVEYAQWLHPKAYPVAIQPDELERVREFVGPGDVAIDVGAHAGDSTLPLAFAVGQTGRVLAFEPNSYVYDVLEQNAQLNPDIGKIDSYNLAITEENGPITFSYGDPGFMNGGAIAGTEAFRFGGVFKQTVEGIRLDDLVSEKHPELFDRIRFVKIDAEGYDYFVLKSMPRILERSRPYLQIEILKGTPSEYRNGMYKQLSDLGYSIHYSGGDLPYGTELSNETLNQYENFDIVCKPSNCQSVKAA